jgi:hypothetical protein
MDKESKKDMKLIISNDTETDVKNSKAVENNYQSDPIKIDLYSKLLAFNKSQRKFNVKDLIKDSLK